MIKIYKILLTVKGYLRSALVFWKKLGAKGILFLIKSEYRTSDVKIKLDKENPALLVRPKTVDRVTLRTVFFENLYDFDHYGDVKCVIDAGANVGYASVYYANRFPNAKIIAIEPEKGNFRMLEKNVRHYKNVIPLNRALWSCNTVLSLESEQANSDRYRYLRNSDGNDRDVATVTIDWIIDAYKLDSIDVLKMDIEGGEKEVLLGSKNWIRRVKTLAIELHEDIMPGCSAALETAISGLSYSIHSNFGTVFVSIEQ